MSVPLLLVAFQKFDEMNRIYIVTKFIIQLSTPVDPKLDVHAFYNDIDKLREDTTLEQWVLKRIEMKQPYRIGAIVRYDYDQNETFEWIMSKEDYETESSTTTQPQDD